MLNRLITYIFLITSVFTACSFAQSSLDNRGLITLEYSYIEGLENKKYKLVKYSFKNGEFFERKVLSKKQELLYRYNFNAVQIIHNRYIVSSSGDVYDLATDEVIYDSLIYHNFIEIVGHKIIFKRREYPSNLDDELKKVYDKITAQYYYYDLNTNEIVEYNKGNKYRVKGTLSINKELGLEFIKTGEAYVKVDSMDMRVDQIGDLVLNRFNGDNFEVIKDLSVGISVVSSFIHELPITWVNDHSFLTQKGNGELILVHLNGEVKYFPKIKNVINSLSPPELYRGNGKEIYYHCPTTEANQFIVDIECLELIEVSPEFIEISDSLSIYLGEQIQINHGTKHKILDEDNNLEVCIEDELMAIRMFNDCMSSQSGFKERIVLFDMNGNDLEFVETNDLISFIGWIDDGE